MGTTLLAIETFLKPFYFISAAASIIVFTSLITYFLLKLGLSEAPPESDEEADTVVASIPDEVWWGSSASLAINSFVIALTKLVLVKQPQINVIKTAGSIALTTVAFLLFVFGATSFASDDPVLGYWRIVATILGLGLIYLSLNKLAEDPIKSQYPLVWGLALSMTAISFTVGILNVIRIIDIMGG